MNLYRVVRLESVATEFLALCTLSRLHVIFCFTVRTDIARSIPSFILYLLFLASPRLVSRRSPGLVYVSFHVLIKSKRVFDGEDRERRKGWKAEEEAIPRFRLTDWKIIHRLWRRCLDPMTSASFASVAGSV